VGNLIRPKGVATDSDGNIYVIESYADYLLVYNAKGDFLLPIGGTGAEIGQFYLPSGVWSDADDRIYIADMFNGRIVILQYLSGRAENTIETSVSTK
jgi:DNA-binding beta-propeller fold protein YncE